MSFPLTFLDISIWLAFLLIMLWLTVELVSLTAGHNLIIDRSRLRLLAIIASVIFLLIVVLRIYGFLS